MVGCSVVFPLNINGSSRISLSVVGVHGWRGRLKLSLRSTLHKPEDRSLVHNKATVAGAAGAGLGGRSLPGGCPGSPVVVSGLPFPAGCTHSSVEDAVSAEYKMALLNCSVMRVGFMVICAFLASPHSVRDIHF